MAMTVCPYCGEQISDKAKKCVHCGAVLIAEEKRFCQECGLELETGVEVCPQCGCPVESGDNRESTPQQVEITGLRLTGIRVIKQHAKIIAGAAACILLIVLLAVVATSQGQKKLEAEYSDNLENAVFAMLSGASKAETCGNLTKKVWYNAIYEESDSSTDKYTKPYGYFVSDFNTAIQNLYLDTSFAAKISEIENNQAKVDSLMKELKNPPEEFENAYEAATDFYNAYLTFTNLVINPTGSLQTFSSNFNDADSETSNCYTKVQMYLED